MAGEEFENREVNVPKSIQQRKCQNWDLNLVHLLNWEKLSPQKETLVWARQKL